MEEPVPACDRRIIALLMSAQVLCGLFASIASSDTNRDIFFAQQIASGQYFPLTGPEINHTIHLGPLWYYLLAPAVWLVPNAAAVTALMGFISALQFPLAYHLGRRFASRQDGLLFSVALALPGWIAVTFASMTHTILVVPALLFAVVAAADYRERPGLKQAALFGLSIALLASAHPTTALLAALLLVWAATRARSVHHAAMLAICAVGLPLLSLAPMLYDQWQGGLGDADTVASYSKLGWNVPSLTSGPAQVYAIVAYGPRYLMRFLADMPNRLERILFAAYILLMLTAAAGLAIRLCEQGKQRRLLTVLFAVLIVQAYFVCAIRLVMPPWMVYAQWPLIAALLAAGLVRITDTGTPGRFAVWLMVGIVIGSTLASYAHFMRGSPNHKDIKASPGKSGSFDIRDYEKATFAYRLPRLSFLELFAIGDALCTPTTLYGQYAYLIDYTFAVSANARCGSSGSVQFGGPLRDDRQAMLGLTKRTWHKLGLVPDRWVGSIGVCVPHQVWSSAIALLPVFPRLENFPRHITHQVREFVVEGDAPASEAVLVGQRAHRYADFEVIEATADGRAVTASYRDIVTYIFESSQWAETVHWRLTIRGSGDYVDVVTFDRKSAGAAVEVSEGQQTTGEKSTP